MDQLANLIISGSQRVLALYAMNNGDGHPHREKALTPEKGIK